LISLKRGLQRSSRLYVEERRINRSEIVISVATKTNWKNTSGFSLLPSLENLRKSSRQLRRTKNSNKISRKLPRSRISYNAKTEE